MKRNILLTALATGLLFTATSCEDGKDEFLSDFSTIMYFRNSGELPVTAYKTGVDTEYNLIVNKSGSSLEATASLEIGIMSDAKLQAYNSANGVNYKALPKECYSFEDGTITFASSDLYKTVKVALKPEAIETHRGTDATYVIPFELTNGSDSINSEKNSAFIIPTEAVPTVGFESTGFVKADNIEGDEGTVTITQNILIPVKNQWDMTVTVEVDKDLLDAYNQAEGKAVPMVANDAYTMEVAPFEKDKNFAVVTIAVDKAKIRMGMQALPLKIKAISKNEFQIDENISTCIVGINKVMPQIELTEEMLSSNATVDGDGTGLAGLFDGRASGKHWHSNYGGAILDATYGHYIDIALNSEITRFAYIFYTRHENANGAPKKTVIYGSTDGTTWNKMGEANTTFTKGDEEYNSDVFTSETPVKFIRFSVIESNSGQPGIVAGANANFWNCGELIIMGK